MTNIHSLLQQKKKQPTPTLTYTPHILCVCLYTNRHVLDYYVFFSDSCCIHYINNSIIFSIAFEAKSFWYAILLNCFLSHTQVCVFVLCVFRSVSFDILSLVFRKNCVFFCLFHVLALLDFNGADTETQPSELYT